VRVGGLMVERSSFSIGAQHITSIITARSAQINQSFWIITSVALTTAETVSPFFRLGRQHCGRDNALNDMVPDPNNHMSHDIAELNLFNLSAQFVSS
jgi:hypothetical protein